MIRNAGKDGREGVIIRNADKYWQGNNSEGCKKIQRGRKDKECKKLVPGRSEKGCNKRGYICVRQL